VRTTPAPARTLAALVATAIACAPTPALAYRTLADVEGSPTPIVWEREPTVALESESFPHPLRAVVAVELQPAAEVWSSVSCAGPLLSIDHAHGASDIRVRYEDDWIASGFGPAAAASTDLVLQSSVDGTSLISATIHLNGRMQWVAFGEARRSDQRDIRVVLIHELGHALGLAHNCEPEDPDLACGAEHAGIVMHPIYGAGGTRLAADDVEGICVLYPIGSPPEPPRCSQVSECYEGELCVEGACHPDRLSGAACSQRSDCATTYCIEESSSPAGGICTRACESSADCPSGAQCVPVEGVTLHVCQPLGSSGATCGVARGIVGRRALRERASFGRACGLALVLAALATARRRRSRS
jgi:hypothetical protein